MTTTRGMAVVPESFKTPNQPTAKPERRQHDATMASVVDVVNAMRAEFVQRLADQEKNIDMRFGHVDTLIGQLRDDQREGQSAIIKAVETIVKLHAENMETIVSHQDTKINGVQACVDENAEDTAAKFAEVNARLDGQEKRLGELEKAPDKHAAKRWRQVAEKVLWAFVGLLLAGAAAGIMQLIEWIKELATK